VRVKVWGDGALFTRPEGKVERVSYPVMTASAARGVLEAILWKPEFRYEIRSIDVLKTPQLHSIVRNEVDSKASISKKFMQKPENRYADDMRQLRHSLYLKDVAYVIHADLILYPETNHPIEKYEAMFARRVEKGQCFTRPYLGTREFSAHFSPVAESDKPIGWSTELGPMFFDFKYGKGTDSTVPFFYDASVEDGTLYIPPQLYKEVSDRVCKPSD